MNYQLRAVTIRTNNSLEGMTQIGNLWTDIMNGKFNLDLPPNGTIISRYSNYESDESGNYDLSVMAVKKDFVEQLEAGAKKGRFRVYRGETDDGDVAAATELARAGRPPAPSTSRCLKRPSPAAQPAFAASVYIRFFLLRLTQYIA